MSLRVCALSGLYRYQTSITRSPYVYNMFFFYSRSWINTTRGEQKKSTGRLESPTRAGRMEAFGAVYSFKRRARCSLASLSLSLSISRPPPLALKTPEWCSRAFILPSLLSRIFPSSVCASHPSSPVLSFAPRLRALGAFLPTPRTELVFLLPCSSRGERVSGASYGFAGRDPGDFRVGLRERGGRELRSGRAGRTALLGFRISSRRKRNGTKEIPGEPRTKNQGKKIIGRLLLSSSLFFFLFCSSSLSHLLLISREG